jgi:hypothetical protein
LLSALVFQLLASALPALALGEVGGTASVDVHEVIAGTQTPFVFTVTNTGDANDDVESVIGGESPDPSLQWVRIGTTTQRVGGTLVPANASGPTGWGSNAVHLDGDGVKDAVVFTGGSLAPGDSANFTVWADAVSLPADRSIEWKIELSDSPDGDTISEAGGVLPSDLVTTIKVLEVKSVAIAAPGGAVDGTATADQANLVYETVVANHASVALPVDPSLTSNNTGDAVTDNAAVSLAPAEERTFSFPVDLGTDTSSRTFTADAVSGSAANASDKVSAPLTVQAAAAFAYVDNTLQPIASVSGASKVFTLSVAKSNPPAVSLNNATLTLTKGSQTFSTNLAAATPFGANNDTQILTFAPVTIPGSRLTKDWDGNFTPSLTVAGSDGNESTVSKSVTNFFDDTFEIDNLVPDVVANIKPPKRTGTIDQVDANGTAVAKDGQTLTFGGTIKKTAGGLADSTATVTSCFIVYKDSDGIEQKRSANLSGPGCKNTAGAITGSNAAASAMPESLASLAVVVTDLAGNVTVETQSTDAVRIDNLAPSMVSAVTGCGPNPAAGCDPFKTIRVNLSEPVIGNFEPFDFLVNGNPVAMATEANCQTQGTVTFCRQVVLTLVQSFKEDDKPTVDYQFRAIPTRSNATDAPTNALPTAKILTALDGIVPGLPTLDTVTQDGLNASGAPVSNARGPQHYGDATSTATAFYTNQNQMTFNIGALADGYKAVVAINDNGIADFQDQPTTVSGSIVPADTLIVPSCEADGATVSCAASSALASGEYDILVTALDAGGNYALGTTGPNAGKRALPAKLVVDNAAPSATGFAPVAATKDISVTFSEALGFGRNTAADWIARNRVSDEDITRYTTASVSGTDETRTVRISSATYTAGSANQLLYTYQGQPNNRYQDRAGNYLGDQMLSL